MILEALGDYLVTNSLGTLGTNIFLGKMPASPDYCITIYEYEGMQPKESFGTAAYDVDMPRIQVVVRGARDDYPTARNKVDTIRQLLASLTDTTISTINIMRVEATGSVGLVGLDEKSRPIMSANFRCMVRL
jgi:hypothetical protein